MCGRGGARPALLRPASASGSEKHPVVGAAGCRGRSGRRGVVGVPADAMRFSRRPGHGSSAALVSNLLLAVETVIRPLAT